MTTDKPLFLNKKELQALTGYVQKPKQLEWLRSRGWRFEVSGKGEILVLAEEVNYRMVSNNRRKSETYGYNTDRLLKDD